MKNHCFCACLLSLSVCLCGCEHPVIPADDNGDEPSAVKPEVLIAENDTARFYLSGYEYSGITLASCPTPQTLITDTRYRMPTKSEVLGALKNAPLPDGYWQSRQRILCYDTATAAYYTYVPHGTVTRAGYKTAYCLLPIRSERKQSTATGLTITINDQWDD